MKQTLLAIAASMALAACAAPAVRHYSLAGPAPGPALPGAGHRNAVTENSEAVHIDVAPVGVPERLARPQMVIRNAGREPTEPVSPQVDVLEQQRWASSLDSELRDAFAGAIAARAGAVDVTRGGRLPGRPVYRIAIRVGHLDAILDRQVDAVFGWTITRSDDSRHAICEVTVSRPAGKGMDALVQAVKQVVAVAADHIADQVAQLQASGAAACNSGATATGLPGATGAMPGEGKAGPAGGERTLPAAAPLPAVLPGPGGRTGAGTGPSPAAGKAPSSAPSATPAKAGPGTTAKKPGAASKAPAKASEQRTDGARTPR